MSQPEARLGEKIRAALEKRGAFVFKVHGSALMMTGLPDLIVCCRGQYIGLEVKMPGNTASKVQEHVGFKILAAGGKWRVVYSVQDALDVIA